MGNWLAVRHVARSWFPLTHNSFPAFLRRRLYNLNSKYGGKDQLVRLTQALRMEGIKPVADSESHGGLSSGPSAFCSMRQRQMC